MDNKKAEAIWRMETLKLHPRVIQGFSKTGKLYCSEGTGALSWLTDDQEQKVREFEQAYNALVYHVMHNYAFGDEELTFLFVSDFRDEWAQERAELTWGYPLAYVRNLEEDWCSEIATVGIKPLLGGVARIY